MKKKSIALIVLTVVVIFCMQVFSYDNTAQKTVKTVTPVKKNIYDSVIATGTVKEGERSEVTCHNQAKIIKIHAETGDYVKEGDLLFEILKSNKKAIDISSLTDGILDVENIDADYIEYLTDQLGIDLSVLGEYDSQFNEENTVKEEIRSPINGVITEIYVKENETVNSKKYAVISDLSKLYVSVEVPQLYIGKIKVGQAAEITGTAFDKKYKGKVEKIKPVATRKSSITGGSEAVVEVYISVSNIDYDLKPGFTVNTKIFTEKKMDSLTLPYECISQDEENRELVYVIKDNKLLKKRVLTGLELENEVEIIYGIEEDEQIVFSPHELTQVIE